MGMTKDEERQQAEDDADVRAITRRRRLAAQLALVEARAAEAIHRQHNERGVPMAQLARDSGLSILAVRMICRPEVRTAHNERRRKPSPA